MRILAIALSAFFGKVCLAGTLIAFYGSSVPVPAPSLPPQILTHASLLLKGDTTSSGSVTTWTDTSPNAYSFVNVGVAPTVLANAINGHKGVHFASSGPQYLAASGVNLAPSNTFSVYMVVEIDSISGSFPTFFNFNSGGSGAYQLGFQYGGAGSDWYFYNDYTNNNNFNTQIVTLSTGTYYYLAFIGDSTQITPYINGVAGTPTPLVQQMSANPSSMFLGSYDGSQFNLDGVVVELDVDNATDTSTQITQMNSYMMTTYGK